MLRVSMLARAKRKATRKNRTAVGIKYQGVVSKRSSDVFQDVQRKAEENRLKEALREAEERRLGPLRELLEKLDMFPPSGKKSITKALMIELVAANTQQFVILTWISSSTEYSVSILT